MVLLTIGCGALVAGIVWPRCVPRARSEPARRRQPPRIANRLPSEKPNGKPVPWPSEASSFLSEPRAFFERQWSFHTAHSNWEEERIEQHPDDIFLKMTEEELRLVSTLRDSLHESVAHLPGSARWLEDTELLRFVRARGGNTEAAARLLEQALRWRTDRASKWGVDVSETGSFGYLHRRYLAFGKFPCTASLVEVDPERPPDWWAFLHEHLHMDVYGADRFGIPFSYNDLGKSDLSGCAREVGIEMLQRYIVYANDYFLDCARAASQKRKDTDDGHPNALHGGIVIVDTAGLSWRHKDEVKVFQEIAQVAKILHPERQRKCFIIRAPWMFSMIWKMISPTLDRRAQEKVSILGIGEPFENLSEELSQRELPESLGGSITLKSRSSKLVPEGAFREFCKQRALSIETCSLHLREAGA